jgi:two-component system chemotaxis response regulator CheV
MSDLMKTIDARTKLAGTNKLEILLFSLGEDTRSSRRETFGINVFKVREVMRAPAVTRAPEMPDSVEGMVSLRGSLVPVIDLARYAGIPVSAPPDIMIVTEYNGSTQGFLVEAVDTILRLDWSAMRVPPEMLVSKMGGLVVAVTELKDDRLVMMLDVERILAETAGQDDEHLYVNIEPVGHRGGTVLFADDSPIARKQIQKTLDAMGVRYICALNGGQAWQELDRLCKTATATKRPLTDFVNLLLTDVEMPEMDGYMLTRQVKSDPRLSRLPVIMHSSLSGTQNLQLGKSVGVDEYVSKFEPQKLADAIARQLREAA